VETTATAVETTATAVETTATTVETTATTMETTTTVESASMPKRPICYSAVSEAAMKMFAVLKMPAVPVEAASIPESER
jgi:hypothetical protein